MKLPHFWHKWKTIATVPVLIHNEAYIRGRRYPEFDETEECSGRLQECAVCGKRRAFFDHLDGRHEAVDPVVFLKKKEAAEAAEEKR